jgi:hypothetical protein
MSKLFPSDGHCRLFICLAWFGLIDGFAPNLVAAIQRISLGMRSAQTVCLINKSQSGSRHELRD